MSRLSLGSRIRSRALRWSMVAGIAAAGVALAAAYGVPLGVRAFVWLVRLTVDGVLWLALALSTGTDLWTIAGTVGRGMAATLVTPQVLGSTGGLLLVGGLALWALRRVFDTGKESTR